MLRPANINPLTGQLQEIKKKETAAHRAILKPLLENILDQERSELKPCIDSLIGQIQEVKRQLRSAAQP